MSTREYIQENFHLLDFDSQELARSIGIVPENNKRGEENETRVCGTIS